jgi:hypothetical protein
MANSGHFSKLLYALEKRKVQIEDDLKAIRRQIAEEKRRMGLAICSKCGGRRRIYKYFDSRDWDDFPCPQCNANGSIPEDDFFE